MSQTETYTSEEIIFADLAPKSIPLKIGDRRFVLHEASAEAVRVWRNHLMKSTKLGPNGKPVGMEGMADSESLLVGLCLFERTDKGEVPVPLHALRAWPSRIVSRLYDEVRTISDLKERDETEETLTEKILELQGQLQEMREKKRETLLKKSPGSTGPTSGSPWSSGSTSTNSTDGGPS